MTTDASLPAPIRRMLEIAYPDGTPTPKTVVMRGSGRLRRKPLPWLPMKVRIFVRPGSDRVMDILVGMGPLTVMRGLDAYIDGRGFTKVAGSMDTGPEFDQGAFHTIVLETLIFPSSWSRLGITWEPIDEDSARLLAPFKDGTETATVRFDPATALPFAYEVPRHRGRGPKIGWRVEMHEWRRFGPVWEPGRITVRWTDEPKPWFTMRIRQVVLDADVSDALARARAALAEATSR